MWGGGGGGESTRQKESGRGGGGRTKGMKRRLTSEREAEKSTGRTDDLEGKGFTHRASNL